MPALVHHLQVQHLTKEKKKLGLENSSFKGGVAIQFAQNWHKLHTGIWRSDCKLLVIYINTDREGSSRIVLSIHCYVSKIWTESSTHSYTYAPSERLSDIILNWRKAGIQWRGLWYNIVSLGVVSKDLADYFKTIYTITLLRAQFQPKFSISHNGPSKVKWHDKFTFASSSGWSAPLISCLLATINNDAPVNF